MEEKPTAARRILVVDDEPYVCDALKMMLSVGGHDVATASNSSDALELFGRAKFDLVITDYSMPGMKGDELAAAIRTQNPNQPIIMITAYVEKLSGENSPLAYVNELVGKPFRFDEIKSAMARALGELARD